MICKKCMTKMEVINSMTNGEITARNYTCPICREKLYTFEQKVEHEKYREFCRPIWRKKAEKSYNNDLKKRKTLKEEMSQGVDNG